MPKRRNLRGPIVDPKDLGPVLRDLKRIHSHICSVAYPVLEAAGELQPNRLRDSESPAMAAEVASDAPKVPQSS